MRRRRRAPTTQLARAGERTRILVSDSPLAQARFKATIAPKKLALSIGRPLILLPQTYGPFEHPRTRQIAQKLVSNATLAFARDPDSFKNLKALLGRHFDPARHREGVDLAFGLEPEPLHNPGLADLR